MSLHQTLMTDFVAAYPAQPATAFWRGIEIATLVDAKLPEGLGLDLGCGDGILTEILLRRGGARRLVGIDIDPQETSAAHRFDFYERIHTCTAHAIPEADETFDFVISNSVLEHIPNLEGVISEVGRVLKRGGEFLFTVPCPAFRDNLSGSLFGARDRDAYLAELDRRLVHLNYLTEADWSQLCERHGLVVDSCQGYLSAAETRRWETLSRFTGGLLHALTRGRKRPIEIQRSLGLRALQNRTGLPRWAAQAVARLISSGSRGPDAVQPSCLLVRGHRR